MTKWNKIDMQPHEVNLKRFAIVLLVVEVIVILLYGLFVRFKVKAGTNDNVLYYPEYQDVNVMMLIGFGFLMTFAKRHAWSALAYTFFINAVLVQLYILLASFWNRVFITGFTSTSYIYLDETTFTAASYSVASILIAFGGVLGRIGPLEMLIMGLVQIVGYALNEQIVYNVIGVFDVGGSMNIHSFGAYFGLTVSLVLSKAITPVSKAQSNYISNVFGMIGTLFLWMFWPSFNAGYFPITDYEKIQVISNTILSLTASCLSTFMMSAFLKEKFNMEFILNATLAGGVIIGAPAGLLYQPGGALAIGALGGVISTLGFHYLGPKLEQKFGLYDTCGIHNLHGMPGVLGGLVSAIVVAAYAQPYTIDPAVTSPLYLTFYSRIHNGSFYSQGGIQVAGTFISVGIGILFGLVAGFIMRAVYSFQAQHFFNDQIYFDDAEEMSEMFPDMRDKQINLQTSSNMVDRK